MNDENSNEEYQRHFIGPERTLVSALLADTSGRCWTVDELDDLTPQDFHDARLGALYALMQERHNAGRGSDGASIVPHLARMLTYGARPFEPSDLVEMSTTGIRATFNAVGGYAREVVEASHFRSLDAAGMRIREIVRADVPLEDAIEMARAEVDGAMVTSATQARSVSEQLFHTIELLSTPNTFRATPWRALNDLIGGWKPGAMYVVGARPGVGKTLFGLQAGKSMSVNGWCAVNTMEMTKDEMEMRFISHIGQIPMDHLLHHKLTPHEWGTLRNLGPVFDQYKLHIDDRSDVGPAQVRNHARTLSRRDGGLAGIVVDYIGLMSSPRGDRRPRQEIVSEFSRAFKKMAKELSVPVMVLSQLNRGGINRADRRPVLEDLRETGALEQDADAVILLSADKDAPEYVIGDVAKHRNGPTGEFVLERHGRYSTLADSDLTPAAVTALATDNRNAKNVSTDAW